MSKIKGSTVLITGGASGIGRIMGRIALEKGVRQLIIWDINEQGINSTIEELRTIGNIKGYKVDISDTAAVQECYKRMRRECGNIDILINNAGIVA